MKKKDKEYILRKLFTPDILEVSTLESYLSEGTLCGRVMDCDINEERNRLLKSRIKFEKAIH